MSQTYLGVRDLRAALRQHYIVHPDDSRGQPYVNRGLVTALRVIEEMAGEVDFEDECKPDANHRVTADVWCESHHAPMGSRWSCALAEKAWVWRDAALAAVRGDVDA